MIARMADENRFHHHRVPFAVCASYAPAGGDEGMDTRVFGVLHRIGGAVNVFAPARAKPQTARFSSAWRLPKRFQNRR